MMRLFSLTLVFWSVTILTVQAQGLRLNIEAGPNFATLSTSQNNGFESDMQAGTHIGVKVSYAIKKHLQVYGGVALSEINFNRNYEIATLEPERFSLGYTFKMIEFPVGVGYIISGDWIDVGFTTGLRPFFTADHNSDRFSDNNEIQQQFHLSDEFNSIGLLAEPGIEIKYDLDEDTRIFAGARYHFDMFGLFQADDEIRRLQRIDLKIGLSIQLF